MRRLSVNGVTTCGLSYFEDMQHFSRLGISSIGIWRQKIETDTDDRPLDYKIVATDLEANDMTASSLSWAGGFTGSCGKTYCDSVDDARDAIYDAYMIGAECLIINPGGQNGHTNKHARNNLSKAIESLLPIATDLGIRLAIEPVTTKHNPWSFLGDFQSHLDFVRSFNNANLGLVLDLYHVGTDLRLLRSLAEIKKEIALVQLSDIAGRRSGERGVNGNRRCLLGDGIVPIHSWVNNLTDIGYDGAFEVEVHGELLTNVSPWRRLNHTCQYLRAIPVAAQLLRT